VDITHVHIHTEVDITQVRKDRLDGGGKKKKKKKKTTNKEQENNKQANKQKVHRYIPLRMRSEMEPPRLVNWIEAPRHTDMATSTALFPLPFGPQRKFTFGPNFMFMC
jgi:hypothetical protein